MCGIVGYLGSAANSLTRVLGAMASILYRAPDSTGAAWFGDEWEPVRVRKSTGALSRFVETLLKEGVHRGQAEILIPLWTSEGRSIDRRGLQKALLRWEGFPETSETTVGREDFKDLIDENPKSSLQITPGTCGSADPRQSYRLESHDDLRHLIVDTIDRFDLPPVVTRTLLRTAVIETLRAGGTSKYQGIDEDTVAELLNELFERTLRTENLLVPGPEPELEQESSLRYSRTIVGESPERGTEEQGVLPFTLSNGTLEALPEKEREVYVQFRRLLQNTSFTIPLDYDRDAVRCLFRLLDGALLSRLSTCPEIRQGVQKILEGTLPELKIKVAMDWLTLYLAEKGLNVFGRAAAAAWAYLRESEMLTVSGEEGTSNAAWGCTDPASLQYFCSPIIAHGRWALQSAVSKENAHPFLDAEGRRAIVLNGQFSPAVEEELRNFLMQAGSLFRSENSAEYMSVLWGHYFEVFRYEQRHSEAIQAQVDSGLDEYGLGSQTIDYRVYSMIKDRTVAELDALSFREAAGKLSSRGGQIAVAGVSLCSPRCMYVASHNRPVFLVRRIAAEEIMVVSDINAAVGLFSQKMVQRKALELKTLRTEYSEIMDKLRSTGSGSDVIQEKRRELRYKEERLLEAFRVSVLPLDGEQRFACIETRLEDNRVRRLITVTDFEGQSIPDLEEFETVLNPLQGEKEVFASFFETHLKEIPERLQDIFNTYLSEGTAIPRLSLKRRLLIRRFGQGLGGLERVVLVGMGSSYHAGLLAWNLYRRLLPEIEILLQRPVEVEHALRLMEPEKDLVILLSWSGTTADMVEFARELEESKISFVVVTNKPYAELGLLAWRSLGVVNLVSGEEVTFSSVKGTYSVLYGTQLLGVWLATLFGRNEEAKQTLETLHDLPVILEQVLGDPYLEQTARAWAQASTGCSKGFVFDDLLYANTGREAAWKLEENGRKIVCRVLDYRDTLPCCLTRKSGDNLVLVNATSKVRLPEALELMKRLFLAGVPFYVLSFDHPLLEQIKYYSQDRVLLLPKCEDANQPFIDLLFFYRFTHRLIEAQGRGVPGFPRNRVKSVTTSRSRQKRFSTTRAELAVIKHDLEQLSGLPDPDYSRVTLWEEQAHYGWERKLYRHIRRIAEVLACDDPFRELFSHYGKNLDRLFSALFDELGEGGEVLFLCCDRTSWAASYEAAAVWGRLLQVPLRIVYRLEELHPRDEQAPIVVVASEVPGSDILDQFSGDFKLPVCWIGPELGNKQAERFSRSLGYYVLSDQLPTSAYANLYAGVLLLLTAAWETARPGKSRVLKSLLCSAGKAITAVLDDGQLRKSIAGFWHQHRNYNSAFYISPPSGIGYIWEQFFNGTGLLSLEHHVYGDSAHGPVATVDPRVEEKFVRIRSLDEMISLYGKQRVSEWENSYGAGLTEHSLWQQTDRAQELKKRGLFYADGYWYLPVCEPGYDASRDNLIILDCSRKRYFEQARDELGVFSCRYARLLLISQKGFYPSGEEELLSGCTAGKPILLPALNQGQVPTPDLLLPFVGNLLAAAFAASRCTSEGIAEIAPIFTAQEEEQRLVQDKLLLLGEVLVDSGVQLGKLEHRQLAALHRLAPLVGAVQGAARFEVRRFPSEKKLLVFLERQDMAEAEEMLEHFRMLHAQSMPFYLMKPEPGSFFGKASNAEEGHLELTEPGWQEVFGTSWEALASGMVEISESKSGLPIIDLPLLSPMKREGRLLRLFVRYLEWDHTQSLASQLRDTLEAMQRGMLSVKAQSPGYLTMVNTFNGFMQSSGGSWADWLIALLPRPWVLYKESFELATVLAQRVEELLKLAPVGTNETRLEEIGKVLDSVWESLAGIEKKKERVRWRGLVEKIRKEVRGGRK